MPGATEWPTLREAYRRALERVAGDGRLSPSWTVEAAADWAWSRVQPSTYAHLVHERGWSHDRYAERTIGSLVEDLLVDG